jgi:hypothetical protein
MWRMMLRNKLFGIEFKGTSTIGLICIVEMTGVVLTFEKRQEKCFTDLSDLILIN